MSNFTSITTDLSIGRLGQPGGFAQLGPDAKVLPSQLPTALAGGLSFQGTYNAATNTPDLTAPAQQVNGALYIVTTQGTQDIGNGPELFTANDSIFYSSSEARWYSIQSSLLALEVTYDNSTSGLAAGNLQTAIDELSAAVDAGTSLPQNSYQFLNRNLTTNVTLTTDENIYQYVTASNPGLNLFLPPAPMNGTHYIVRNSPGSPHAFSMNTRLIEPGDIYEVKFNGINWIEL